jgi:aspartate carbamoyltransferase catalytic subunit
MSDARHLVAVDDLSDAAVRWLLDRALALARGAPPRTLDASVANLFSEPSTRTRVSFELAARRLSMHVINIELDRSSSSKGETLEDTVATLAAMGVDCLVLRHPQTGRVAELARSFRAGPVILNGGDGSGEHPSQALLDAAALESSGLQWSESTIAVIGDIRHSRVARSGLKLFGRLGAGCLRVAGPPELMPERLDDSAIERCRSLDEAVRGADAVMMLRLQRERMDAAGWPNAPAYHPVWGLRREHLALAAEGCRVMHPGPLNRGVEIASDVADGTRSLILEQVRMGVFMRTALFEWLLSDRASSA